MKYRKKPVVIDAILWTGKNLKEVTRFTDQKVILDSPMAHDKWEQYCSIVGREGLKISTLEGEMSANIGDFIIRGVKGEFYPCKPDIFDATYDRVESLCEHDKGLRGYCEPCGRVNSA